MTDPKLSLTTSGKIGRLYQTPSENLAFNHEKKIMAKKAHEGVQAGLLFPSITNVIGCMSKDLEGYATFMMSKAIREGKNTNEASKEYIVHRDAAGARGTRVHGAIEDFIAAGYADEQKWLTDDSYMLIPSFKAMIVNNRLHSDLVYWAAFINFITDYAPVFTHQEATVYGETSTGLKYAGTTDFVAVIAGKTYVGDWKTSSKMSSTVSMQLAAVINATHITTDFTSLEPMFNIDAAVGIHLAKDGTYGVYLANVETGWAEFQALRSVWEHYAFEGMGRIEKVQLVKESEQKTVTAKSVTVNNLTVVEVEKAEVYRILAEEVAPRTIRPANQIELDCYNVTTVIHEISGDIAAGVMLASKGFLTTDSANFFAEREIILPAMFEKFTEEYDKKVWYIDVDTTLETGKVKYVKA